MIRGVWELKESIRECGYVNAENASSESEAICSTIQRMELLQSKAVDQTENLAKTFLTCVDEHCFALLSCAVYKGHLQRRGNSTSDWHKLKLTVPSADVNAISIIVTKVKEFHMSSLDRCNVEDSDSESENEERNNGYVRYEHDYGYWTDDDWYYGESDDFSDYEDERHFGYPWLW